jgi:hypothetical protein
MSMSISVTSSIFSLPLLLSVLERVAFDRASSCLLILISDSVEKSVFVALVPEMRRVETDMSSDHHGPVWTSDAGVPSYDLMSYGWIRKPQSNWNRVSKTTARRRRRDGGNGLCSACTLQAAATASIV